MSACPSGISAARSPRGRAWGAAHSVWPREAGPAAGTRSALGAGSARLGPRSALGSRRRCFRSSGRRCGPALPRSCSAWMTLPTFFPSDVHGGTWPPRRVDKHEDGRWPHVRGFMLRPAHPSGEPCRAGWGSGPGGRCGRRGCEGPPSASEKGRRPSDESGLNERTGDPGLEAGWLIASGSAVSRDGVPWEGSLRVLQRINIQTLQMGACISPVAAGRVTPELLSLSFWTKIPHMLCVKGCCPFENC